MFQMKKLFSVVPEINTGLSMLLCTEKGAEKMLTQNSFIMEVYKGRAVA